MGRRPRWMEPPVKKEKKEGDELTCVFCGREFWRERQGGPLPKYCSRKCRQWAYEKRKGIVRQRRNSL